MAPVKESPIEDYVDEVVKKALESREIKLKAEDAEAIIQAIIPEIEKIVAKVVKKHILSFSVYVQNILKDPEE